MWILDVVEVVNTCELSLEKEGKEMDNFGRHYFV